MTMTEHNYSGNSAGTTSKRDLMLPTMIVFDLDDCLWSPEMYTLSDVPSIPEEGDLTPNGVSDLNLRGCVGMKVPRGPTVKLYSGARRVLYELATNPMYKGIILASASSSEEPTFSFSCLRGIEILPELTIERMFQYNQIGRSGLLSSDKRTHFRLLHQESRVPYNEMIFFDDCNWGDHCATVAREFGVVTMRTPRGLQYSEFQEALEKYRKEVENRESRMD
jgi:magnesium-dependent phosphatase 1